MALISESSVALASATISTVVATATETVAEAVATTVEMVADASATELSLMRATVEANVAALAAMTISYEAAQAALNALTAEKAELAVKAEAAKYTARKEKVVSAIGASEKSEALMLATQDLSDASFDAVVKALAGSVDAEASTGLFAEVGVSAVADTTKIVAESPEMKILKQKFKSAK